MPSRPGLRLDEGGTRFRIYPQSRKVGFKPIVAHVDVEPRDISPGPTDAMIETIDAINKLGNHRDKDESLRKPPPKYRPREPLRPNPDGHFEFEAGTPEFSVAAPFAIVHTVLRIWRHYFERAEPWTFPPGTPERLQVFPHIRSYNAWSGGGTFEFGYPDFPRHLKNPFCENFEVVAHETGHLIMKSVVGTMPDDEKSIQHRAHEEAAADLIAMFSVLQFDSVVDRVLGDTDGQLYGDNVLSWIGEWGVTGTKVVRRLFNEATMASARDVKEVEKHGLSLPFSGAVFDLLVEVFKGKLVDDGKLAAGLAKATRHVPDRPIPRGSARLFARARRTAPDEFRQALLAARDDVARLLARAWRATPRIGVTYAGVAGRLLDADAELAPGGRYGALISELFRQRGIVPERPA